MMHPTQPHRSRFLYRFRIPILTAVLLLSIPTLAVACPTCKEGLTNGANDVNLVRGFGWSIIFMMSLPFTILSVLGSYFYLLVRREQRRLRIAGGPTPLPAYLHQ
jgi:hypothetical protein